MTGLKPASFGGSVPHGLYPDPSSMAAALSAAPERSGKADVVLSSYNVEVFDMGDESDRKRYSDTMLKVFPGIKSGRCVVWRNDQQVMTRKDGSTMWMKCLEWSEYEISGQDSVSIG